MIFRKKANLSSYFDTECNSAESLTSKDKLRDLKNILNEIKKTGTIERTRNEWNKKLNKKKTEYTGWWNKRYHRKVRCKFNDFKTKMYIFRKTI